MFRAAVSEAAINEDGQTFTPKKEVRSAENTLMPAPASDAVPPEQFHQAQLGVFISPSVNLGHDLRTFGLGEYIGHHSVAICEMLADFAGMPSDKFWWQRIANHLCHR